MFNRRTFLKVSALTTAAISSPAVLRYARAADGDITVGVPLPMSGPFAANGKFGSMGSAMAVEEAVQATGRKFRYQEIDTEGKPANAVRKVQEAMGNGVVLFSGGILSSEALAMAKEIDKGRGVFMTTAGADEITGSDCNKSTFRWSVPTFGAIDQTVRPLIEQMPEAKRWYTITPQYVFGDGLLNAAKAVFAEKGIEHVGNSYHSLSEKEFSGHLTNALAAQPDVLLILNFGSQSSDTLRQAASFGMKNRSKILLAWASGLEQFEALGADLMDGVYFGAQYWHGIENEFNNAFVERTQKLHGMNPNYALASNYLITKILLDAATKAGTADSVPIVAAMEGLKYQGLTGEEEIRAADHQVIKNYYLLKGKPKASMSDKDDYADIISSGMSFLSPEQAGCKMT